MEDNSPQDEFKVSADQLKEYLQSSPKDPDYEVSNDTNRRFSSNPMRDELMEMISIVHQAVSKLDEGIESRTERCIDLLEKLSDACMRQTKVLAEHEQAIEQLQRIVNSNKRTIAILTGLTLLSMCSSLIILATILMTPHQ